MTIKENIKTLVISRQHKCHCYGARTLTESVSHNDYKGRHYIEQDETIKRKAIEAWNTRTPQKEG